MYYDLYEKYRLPFTTTFFVLNIINYILTFNIIQFIAVCTLLLAFNQIAYYYDWYYKTYCKSSRNITWIAIGINIILIIFNLMVIK